MHASIDIASPRGIQLLRHLEQTITIEFASPSFALLSSPTYPAGSKLLSHLSSRHPLNTLMCIYPFDKSLMHHQDMRPTRNLRMNANGKDECIVVVVAPGEHVLPCALHAVWINITMLKTV